MVVLLTSVNVSGSKLVAAYYHMLPVLLAFISINITYVAIYMFSCMIFIS